MSIDWEEVGSRHARVAGGSLGRALAMVLAARAIRLQVIAVRIVKMIDSVSVSKPMASVGDLKSSMVP